MFSKLFSALSPEAIKAAFVLKHVTVAHFTEGRIRVIYEAVRHDNQAYAQLCEHLDAVGEIDEYTVNRTTGSIVISYTPGNIVPDSFLAHLIDGARNKFQRGA